MAEFINIGDGIAFRKSAITSIKVILSKNDANCQQNTLHSLIVESAVGESRVCNYIGINDNLDANQVFQEVLDELNG